MTIWVPGGFRIKGIDSSIRIRFLFIIQKSIKLKIEGRKGCDYFCKCDLLGVTIMSGESISYCRILFNRKYSLINSMNVTKFHIRLFYVHDKQ